jgi:hypothetical protein
VLIHVGQNKSSGAKLVYIDRHDTLVHFDRSNTKHGMRAIHILAVLLLLAAGAAAGAEKKACHGGDEAALLAVKAAFSNASSFVSWTPNIPCCHWPGIDCSDDDGSGGTTGRVVSLAILRDDGITGAVPGDAIAGLTRLQILFLFDRLGSQRASSAWPARTTRAQKASAVRPPCDRPRRRAEGARLHAHGARRCMLAAWQQRAAVPSARRGLSAISSSLRVRVRDSISFFSLSLN